ncbi:MAG: hypothetical protein QW367_00595 [Candidatus Aenigmatarchaeota archaeon]
MKSYEEMLEEALKKLPDVFISSDRYAIPEIEVKYEKNKTYVLNIKEILFKIKRKEEDFKGDFSRIVGIPARFENDILVLNGLVNKEILRKKLEDYIKNFVICDVCNKPETIIIEENKIRYLKCEACGNKKILRY